MKCAIIGIESMVGVSKKTGKDYALYKINCMAKMTDLDRLRETPDYKRVKDGFNVIEVTVNELLHRKVEKAGAKNGYPFNAVLKMEQRIGGNNQLYNECVDIDLESVAAARAS